MDFFAWTRITFTAELSVLDLFLKTVHGDMLVRASVDAEYVTRSTKELMFLTSLVPLRN
jgi:hypothetical protein